mgnify:CR=1 FL=1
MQRTKKKNELSPLYDAFLALKTRAEAAAFLRDLCTRAELDAFAERLAIARALFKDLSYRDAADTLGASVTTVTRVAHWLNHGQGGYRTVIERLKK